MCNSDIQTLELLQSVSYGLSAKDEYDPLNNSETSVQARRCPPWCSSQGNLAGHRTAYC